MLYHKLKSRPENLFIVDGAGALFSAFMLGVLMYNNVSLFGMPQEVLLILASIPCFFALIDLLSYYLVLQKRSMLRLIAVLNIGYCILSIYFIFIHYEKLQMLAWVYLLSEIIIILLLSRLEWKRASVL